MCGHPMYLYDKEKEISVQGFFSDQPTELPSKHETTYNVTQSVCILQDIFHCFAPHLSRLSVDSLLRGFPSRQKQPRDWLVGGDFLP